MDNEKLIELVTERLIQRIEDTNTYILKDIGKSIKQIRDVTPSKRHQLIQILRYGDNYQNILNKISKMTNLSIKDIEEIFMSVSKRDYNFAKRFYEARNIKPVPFKENAMLISQTRAIASMVQRDIYNFTRENVLGYSIRDINGNVQFQGLRETYNRVLEEAMINISSGKETFDNAMYRVLNDIGGSGLKTLDYNGRSIRLDSMIRMHMNGALRNLHNENQKLFGEEFYANGVEVTHHENAAPDHIDTVDGKQFANIKAIREQIASGIEKNIKYSDIKDHYVRVNGKRYDDFDYINNNLTRPVSTLNCRHTTFAIVLGVSKPRYTEEQLKADKEQNEKGFDLDGQHYTMYEGTQLQRQLETAIRKQKDIQILGKSSGNQEMIYKAQYKINILSDRYKELSQISGLPTRMERLRVSGFKKVAGNTRSFYEKSLIGNTYNGIKINSVSKHLLDRKTSRDLQLNDIKDGLSKPLKITNVKIDSEGRQSLQYIGEHATIVLNPTNGNIVSVWKTGSNRVKKLKGDKK